MSTPAPPRLYIPNGLQMTLKLSQVSQEAVVVLGAEDLGAQNRLQLAEAWRDAAWAAFRPLISATTSCTGAVVRSVSGPDAQVHEIGPPATSPNGGNTNQQALAGGCTLLKWSTATGGRTGKGRTYLPGLPLTAVNTDGRTYATAWAAPAAAAIAAYLGASFWGTLDATPAVLSFTRGATRPITGGALAGVIGVQRRRMR